MKSTMNNSHEPGSFDGFRSGFSLQQDATLARSEELTNIDDYVENSAALVEVTLSQNL